MPTSFRTVLGSTFVFLAVGLVALLGILGATYWLSERAQAYFTLTSDVRDFRTAAVELRSAWQAAESSQRGYLLTGNEIYLSPYEVAKTNAARQLAALQGQATAYPEAALPVARVGVLMTQKFDELDRTIALKRARQDAEALAIIMTNKGKTLTDEANVFFTGLIRRADDRLTQGADEQRANATWLRLVSALAGVLIIGVVGGAATILLRYTRDLRVARDDLNSLNADLERRVEDRTMDLSVARDRAEMLLREVNHRVANSLALVSSMISLQANAVKDESARHALTETQDRIFAVSLVHRRLYSSNEVGMVSLDEYLGSLLEHLKTSLKADMQRVTLSYTLASVKLATDASVNLGVILTEWVTNAFKYAYPAGGGEVRVTLAETADGQVELAVEDDGVGKSGTSPGGTGLGTRIVAVMANSLRGRAEYTARQPGTRASVVLPLSAG